VCFLITVECWGKSIYVMWGLIIVSDSGGQMAPPDSRSQASHSSKYVNGQTKSAASPLSGIADHLGSSAGTVPMLCEFMRVQLLVLPVDLTRSTPGCITYYHDWLSSWFSQFSCRISDSVWK
jgi:hypothetical protein